MYKEIKLYDDKVVFNLPEEFAEVKDTGNLFLSGKPDFVFSDNKTNALVSVLKTDFKASDTLIDDRIVEYCDIHKRAVPNFDNFKIAKKNTASGNEIAAFYYTSTSPKRDLYNFFVLTYLDGYELIFSFHCGVEDAVQFGVKFMNILNSIDVRKLT